MRPSLRQHLLARDVDRRNLGQDDADVFLAAQNAANREAISAGESAAVATW